MNLFMLESVINSNELLKIKLTLCKIIRLPLEVPTLFLFHKGIVKFIGNPGLKLFLYVLPVKFKNFRTAFDSKALISEI